MESGNVLTIEDFPKICRICLSSPENLKIINNQNQHLLKEITGIDMGQDEDILPKNVCQICISRLDDVVYFIELVKCSDKTLKEILKHDDSPYSPLNTFSDNDTLLDEPVKTENSEDVDIVKVEIVETENKGLPKLVKSSDVKKSKKSTLTCSICNEQFKTVKDLKCHQKLSQRCAPKRRKVECQTCNTSFKSLKGLKEHFKQSEQCTYNQCEKCSFCEQTFETAKQLKEHLLTHNVPPYECKVCGAKFKFAQNLKRHDNISHKGIKPFKCDICGKAMTTLKSKNRHQSYLCKNTPSLFTSNLSKISDKQNSVSNIENSFNVKEENVEITCRICNKVFRSKPNLRKHLLRHGEKKHLCVHCGKSFFLKQQLDEHFRIHTGLKPHSCNECGKSFRLYNYYKVHILTHTGEKPHQCQICQRRFLQKSHLKRHVDLHAGQKPYECSVCGKKFANKNNLGVHSRIHTGETTHVCHICSKGFYDTSNLKRHMKIHRQLIH